MATRTEHAVYMKRKNAETLEEAARVIRRRLRGSKPAGVSLNAFCRVLTMEAANLRAELAQAEPS